MVGQADTGRDFALEPDVTQGAIDLLDPVLRIGAFGQPQCAVVAAAYPDQTPADADRLAGWYRVPAATVDSK